VPIFKEDLPNNVFKTCDSILFVIAYVLFTLNVVEYIDPGIKCLWLFKSFLVFKFENFVRNECSFKIPFLLNMSFYPGPVCIFCAMFTIYLLYTFLNWFLTYVFYQGLKFYCTFQSCSVYTLVLKLTLRTIIVSHVFYQVFYQVA
jgi:hypothetical protein